MKREHDVAKSSERFERSLSAASEIDKMKREILTDFLYCVEIAEQDSCHL